MRSSADQTKAALIRAAEQLMAEHGVEGAELNEIVELAGQRNRSAVLYHFGGRDGLVAAIIAKHRGPINRERHRMLDEIETTGDLTARALASAAILPLARSLRTPSGRDYVVILCERATRLGSAGIYAARGPIADSVARTNALLARLVSSDSDTTRTRGGELELVAVVLIADIARDINRRALTVKASVARVESVIDLFVLGIESLGSPARRPG